MNDEKKFIDDKPSETLSKEIEEGEQILKKLNNVGQNNVLYKNSSVKINQDIQNGLEDSEFKQNSAITEECTLQNTISELTTIMSDESNQGNNPEIDDIEKKIKLDSDTEIKLSIPSNLYIDEYEENENLESNSISLMNFLNNNNDNEYEEKIEDKMDLIFSLLEENNILLIQGNTGCGKTTKIPRFLLEKYKRIVCTQPRRIAAISVAKKVAKDMETNIGEIVGYSVRFDSVVSGKTRLKFVTDGIILKEILHDKNLDKYDCIIIDEAHERSFNIDILLGYSKMLLKTRKNLKIIIMSATISTERFVNFFDCPCVTIKHKVYPLKNYFIKSYEPINYFEETLKTVIKLYKTEPTGDVLVFLTGQEEIQDAFHTLIEHVDKDKCDVLMVYSSMTQQDQELIFKKTKKRKIILSTNICETSITIENIVYVVDCGRVKMKRYSESLGIEILDIVNISKAQAKQRSGRAGRTQPGTVFRIFTRKEYNNMKDNPTPEILSCNLNDAVIILKSLGINELKAFDMIDKPSLESINNSLEYLFITRAIDVNGEVTQLGKRISSIPLDANLSISLVASVDFGCFDEVSIIVSMLSVDQIFMDISKTNFLYKKYLEKRESLKNSFSDFIMLLDIFKSWENCSFDKKYLKSNFLSARNMWQAKKIREQLKKQFNVKNSSNRGNVLLAFCAGFYPNTAKIAEGSYKTIFNQTSCFIHPTSCIFKKYSKFILYFSITKTKKEYLRYCNEITTDMLCSVLNRTSKPKKYHQKRYFSDNFNSLD